MRGVAGYALPEGMEVGLEASINWRTDQMPYANGFHACEVEVDPETGQVEREDTPGWRPPAGYGRLPGGAA